MARRHALSSAIAALALLVASSPVAALSWGPVVTVSGSGNANHPESLALAGSTAHVIYHSGVGNGVWYRRSTNGGSSWSSAAVLAKRLDLQMYYDVAVAARGSVVAVLYRGYNRTTNQHTLLLRRSVDRGATWQRRVIIASYIAPERIGGAGLAMGGSTTVPSVHVAWTDGRTGTIRYRRSMDAGATFATVANLGTTTAIPYASSPTNPPPDGFVRVAASGPRAYVSWTPSGTRQFSDPAIMRRSLDSGASFGGAYAIPGDVREILTTTAYGSHLLFAHVGADWKTTHISHSADSGSSFSSVTVGEVRGDLAVVGGGQARFVHAGPVLGMRTSGDYGATWSGVTAVVGSAGEQNKAGPNVVLTSSSTLVSWSPNSLEGRGVYARRGQ